MTPSVGNEHFKSWLKQLDPGSRVHKMSAIAQTQFSAGLKGSLIKASLAQLSQKCQVMMIKLTPGEINHYMRRKPVKQLHDFDSPKEVTSLEKKKLKLHNNYAVDGIESCLSKTNEVSVPIAPTNIYADSSCSATKLITSATTSQTNVCTTFENKTKVRKAKKRKYQELFGDDLDDLTETRCESVGVNNANLSANEQRTNNYFNTVNVNIYNSTSDSNNDKSRVIVEKKSKKLKKDSHIKKALNNKLKIDVSVPNDITSICKENLAILSEQNAAIKQLIALCGSNKKPKSSRKSNLNKKRKAKLLHIPSDLNNKVHPDQNVEDPSIKELWSILGMESPTDRRERIINSYPLQSQSKQSHTIVSSQITEVPLTSPNDDNTTVNPSNENGLLNSENPLLKGTKSTEDSPSDCGKIPEDTEPFCKISKTFSLANKFPQDSDSCNNSTKSIQKEDINSGATSTELDVECLKDTQHFKSKPNTSDVDSITILSDSDDDESPNNGNKVLVSDNTNIAKDHDKIGTIRVKSLGLLMNPDFAPPHQSPRSDSFDNSVHNIKITVTDTNEAIQYTLSNNDDEILVENRFLLTYKHYFDHFVESGILKLGELLHLAIADLTRKEKRIKQAEQLSSDDLINDEKQRAEKDFNDMMKTRSHEFSPLFQTILSKFDELSKITLFISLFCRLVKHAEKLDPANKNCVIKAREVIKLMLLKHQFKDTEITMLLNTEPEHFQHQVNVINKYIINCTKTHEAQSLSISPNNQPNKDDIQSCIDTTSLVRKNATSSNVAAKCMNDLTQPKTLLSTNKINILPPSRESCPTTARIVENNRSGIISANVQNSNSTIQTKSFIPNQTSNHQVGLTNPTLAQDYNVVETLNSRQMADSSPKSTNANVQPLNGPLVPSTYIPSNKSGSESNTTNQGLIVRRAMVNGAFIPATNVPSNKSGSESNPTNQRFIVRRAMVNGPFIPATNVPSNKSGQESNKTNHNVIGKQVTTNYRSVSQSTAARVCHPIKRPPPSTTTISTPHATVIQKIGVNQVSLQPVNIISPSTALRPSQHNIRPPPTTTTISTPNATVIPTTRVNQVTLQSVNGTTATSTRVRDCQPNISLLPSTATAISTNGVNQVHGGSSLQSSKEMLSLRDLLHSQNAIPSSSHCHPFVKTMPISRKMDLLFDNSSSS